jgi:hypothetical protein
MNKKHGLFIGFAVLLAAIFTLAGCDTSTGGDTDWVDAYTSATQQGTGAKQFLEGADLETARDELVKCSDNCETLAEKNDEGYEENPNGRSVQALSINPDGTVNNSSLGSWKYIKGDDLSSDQVLLLLTHGQTSENYEERKGGTVLMKTTDLTGSYLLVHVRLGKIDKIPFNQADFEAGEYPSGYSGASKQLSNDYVYLDVLAIELTTMMMFQ